MNFKFFKKSKIVLTGLIALLGVTSISSCSSFFGADYTISNVEQRTDQTTGDTIVTITFENEDINPLTLRIPTVTDGIGIESIVPTTENDKVIFTITYTNNDTQVFEVPIVNGTDGVGVEDVVIGEDDEGNPTIEFLYTDGETSGEIPLPRGRDGVGIAAVTPNPDPENNQTIYTMTFTDDREPVTFAVKDGVSIDTITLDEENTSDEEYVLNVVLSNGDSIRLSLPRPKNESWLTGVAEPDEDLGKDGDFYINLSTGYLFIKMNGKWKSQFCMKGQGYNTTPWLVTFALNEGENCFYLDQNYESGSVILATVQNDTRMSIEDIPTPTKDGFVFEGWYTDLTNPNSGKFTDLTLVKEDISLVARWSEI